MTEISIRCDICRKVMYKPETEKGETYNSFVDNYGHKIRMIETYSEGDIDICKNCHDKIAKFIEDLKIDGMIFTDEVGKDG